MNRVILPRLNLEKTLPFILLVAGIVGVICSFILSLDEIQLLQNAKFTPNCNLNPVISCGSVMQSHEGAIFGFPNSWIGLVTFAVIATVGGAILAGAQFKRWFWLAFEAGIGAGMIFAYWMLFSSIYKIQALCPYCLTVDIVLTTTFWYLTLYVLGREFKSLPKRAASAVSFARKHHAEILVTWFLLIIALILQHFWYYYGQFI